MSNKFQLLPHSAGATHNLPDWMYANKDLCQSHNHLFIPWSDHYEREQNGGVVTSKQKVSKLEVLQEIESSLLNESFNNICEAQKACQSLLIDNPENSYYILQDMRVISYQEDMAFIQSLIEQKRTEIQEDGNIGFWFGYILVMLVSGSIFFTQFSLMPAFISCLACFSLYFLFSISNPTGWLKYIAPAMIIVIFLLAK